MTEQTYAVEGMTCAHCAGAVSREVRRIEGVSDDAIAAAVDEAGYTVVTAR